MSIKLDQAQGEFIQMKTGINIDEIQLKEMIRIRPPYPVTTMALGEENRWW